MTQTRFISARFTVPGSPVGKQSPRMTRTGRTYIPARSRNYMNDVTLAAGSVLDSQIEGPLRVTIGAYKSRPKRLCRKRDPEGRMWCPVKPDADNISKSILDGLKPWFDDAQVVILTVFTYYAEKGSNPRAEVSISRVDGPPCGAP